MKRFADIHSHCTLLAFNSGTDGNYNRKLDESEPPTLNDMVWEESMSIIRYSQADFKSLQDGNVKLVFAALYPIERNFLEPVRALKILDKLNLERIAIQFDKKRIRQLEETDSRKYYFKDLCNEFNMLHDNQVINLLNNTPYKIISSYADLQELETSSPETIAVVITVEGANAFGISDKEENVKTQLLSNINTVKKWKNRKYNDKPCSPLFVTFCHHFYNNLAGHCISIPKVSYNQRKGVNTKLSDFGKEIIRLLLSKTEGRRILIDIKHMSIKARQDYYYMLDTEYNKDNIPIVMSHGAVNGLAKFENHDEDVEISEDTEVKGLKKLAINKYKEYEGFNKWSINLFDDEIERIHKSGGLMGLILDQRVLAGGKKVQKVMKKYPWINTPDESYNDWQGNTKFETDWITLFYDQVEYIYQLLVSKGISPENCFNSICIGSDFDGMINAIDPVNTSKNFPILEKNLTEFFTKNHDIYIQSGLDATQIVNKIMYSNVKDFLKRYYNEEYLTGTE